MQQTRVAREGRWRHAAAAPASVLLSLLVLLAACGAAPARGLSGTAACPNTSSSSTAWCQERFGGAGGTVTAGSWSTNAFSCVCNGAVSLTITRTMDTTSTTSTTARPSAGSSSSSGSLSSMSSSSESYSLSMSSSSQSYSLSMSSSSESLSSSMSSLSSGSSSAADANYTCSWSGVFTEYPDGTQCLASTGICPTSCSQMPPYVCDTQQAVNCFTNANGLYYQCLTCKGQLFTIATSPSTSCSRTYKSTPTCDPGVDCSAHGCCNNAEFSGNNATTGGAVCTCYANSSVGFYTGARCRDCAANYAPNADNVCNKQQQPVQIVLAAIAKTWTMVSPNMAVLFLFVIFSLVRKLNTSDEPFELTGLRRANLSTVQVARRRQQSLFHSKYVPMRPAQSRSFANTQQPRTRGPSAY